MAQAIVDEQLQRLRLLGRPPNPLQSLVDLTYAVAGALVTEVRLRAALRLVIDRTPSVEGELIRASVAAVEQLLRAARDHGQIAADEPAADLAQFIVGSFVGIQLTSEVLTSRRDLPDRLDGKWMILGDAVVVPGSRHAIVGRPGRPPEERG